ncbi:MAG TPA: PIN domain nuclease [Candidatus Polarisedimenticolaceae bacterium]|nr:PIN domain nuclease [Candidatus Polarisedimenticolaceae bacterium]
MMVVDSGAWIDFFNGAGGPHATRLREALRAEEDLVTLPIVVAEVLQGIRSDVAFEQARGVLEAVPCMELGPEGHVRAASLYRRLRKRGVTVRGIVDCLVAQACLDFKAQLLSPDADFAHIARHAPLRVWSGVSG